MLDMAAHINYAVNSLVAKIKIIAYRPYSDVPGPYSDVPRPYILGFSCQPVKGSKCGMNRTKPILRM